MGKQTNGPWSQDCRIIFVCFVIYCNISFLSTCSNLLLSPASHRLEVAPTSHIEGGGAEPGRMISFGLQFAITADEFLLMRSFHLESRSLRHPVIQSFYRCVLHTCIHKRPNVSHQTSIVWIQKYPYLLHCSCTLDVEFRIKGNTIWLFHAACIWSVSW